MVAEGPWPERVSLSDDLLELPPTPVGSVATATVVVLYEIGYSYSELSPIEHHSGSPFSYEYGDADRGPRMSLTDLVILFEPERSGYFEEVVYVETEEPQDPFTIRAEPQSLMVMGEARTE